MKNEIRELNADELDAVSGGSRTIVDPEATEVDLVLTDGTTKKFIAAA